MADGVTFTIADSATLAAIDARLLRTDRAGMWVVRQTGRVAKSAARGRAPVASGRLRDSIKSSRSLRGVPGSWSVRVASFDWPAAGYAGKEDAKHHFMEAGQKAAEMAMPAISAVAFGRVWV